MSARGWRLSAWLTSRYENRPTFFFDLGNSCEVLLSISRYALGEARVK